MGLKPSAIRGEARLRGLERNNYSKTISAHAIEGDRRIYSVVAPQHNNQQSYDVVLSAIAYRLSLIAYRLRSAPGYAGRSLPARAMADDVFKDHHHPVEAGNIGEMAYQGAQTPPSSREGEGFSSQG